MYEENKIEFDWKGFLIKLALLIIVIILIIKLLPLENKNTSKEFSTEFNNNMSTLRENSIDYFTLEKLPKLSGESQKISLEDLIKVGAVRSLNDTDGVSCDLENSYVKANNKTNNYELEINLICGKESETSFVYLPKTKNNDEENTTTTTKVSEKKESGNLNSGETQSGSKTNNVANIITSKVVKTTKSATRVSVIFNSNGGTIVSSQSIKIGSKAIKPINPIKQGYIFLGWFNENNKEHNFNTNISNTLILKAKWKIVSNSTPTVTTTKPNATTTKATTKYLVTFNSNGGNNNSSQIVDYGGYVSKPSNPNRSNAKFLGWYLGNKEFNFNTRITSNITLIARYNVTESITTDVYSIGWGSQVSNFTVTHTLAIPSSLKHSDFENVRINSLWFERSLNTTIDLTNYDTYRDLTFENASSNYDYTTGKEGNFATIGSVTIKKTSTEIYSRNITWNGWVTKQCSTPYNYIHVSNACLYGIKYKVNWNYEIFR